MNARAAWGLLGIVGLAALGAAYVTQQQPPRFSSIATQLTQTSAGPETTLKLNATGSVQRISWTVFYRGEIIGGGGIARDKPQRLEPVTLVFNPSSRFSTKSCPDGGFLVNGQTLCSRIDSSFDPRFDLFFGYPSERLPANRWIPTVNATTRAGAQAKNGTKDALVLWVMFENPDLPKGAAGPPMKYRPYADYLKP